MTETEKNNIKLARQFLIDQEDQKALDCYLEVYKENNDNAEASYWVYTAYWRDCIDNNKSAGDKWIAFTAVSNSLREAVEQIAKSEGSDLEKSVVLLEFVYAYIRIVNYAVLTPMATPKDRIELAVLTLYWTGDAIERNFGSSDEALKTACAAWKEGVKLQQKFYAYSYSDNKAEDYVEKIKKVEPDYVAPGLPLMKKIIDKIKELINKKG